jgi:hypothetical protein
MSCRPGEDGGENCHLPPGLLPRSLQRLGVDSEGCRALQSQCVEVPPVVLAPNPTGTSHPQAVLWQPLILVLEFEDDDLVVFQGERDAAGLELERPVAEELAPPAGKGGNVGIIVLGQRLEVGRRGD